MKDQLRDPNTLELFPEVMNDLEKIPHVKSSKKTKKSKTTKEGSRNRLGIHEPDL